MEGWKIHTFGVGVVSEFVMIRDLTVQFNLISKKKNLFLTSPLGDTPVLRKKIQLPPYIVLKLSPA